VKIALLGLLIAPLAATQTPSFDYDRAKPLDIRVAGTEMRGMVRIDDISFASLEGGRTAAYLIIPPGRGKVAGALFVHWYDSESPLSNRKQFLNEAVELARHSLLSLLVATPWSDPQWYQKRDASRDFENSVQEVRELRRALDVLASQPRVDRKRVALVGHDFGGMYGILAAASEKRVSAVALQAFTGSFSDWFLYNQKQLTADARQRVIDGLAPLDPLKFIGQLGSTPVLLQFAERDLYVPRDHAEALYAAVRGPKQILWYEAGHGLNDQASQERQRWLREVLTLK
jgi:dienelactone hydrolase